MPGTTGTFGWPYPVGNDSPAGHTQIQNLAQAIDASLKTVRDGINTNPSINNPLIRLVLQADFPVANNNLNVAVPFGSGTEEYKTHASMHSTTTLNTRVIIPVAGYYRASWHPGWLANGTGFRAWQIGRNGVRLGPEVKTYATVNNGTFAGPAVTRIVRCNVNDYLEAFIFQQSGGPVSIAGGGDLIHASAFEVEFIRHTTVA